MGAVANKTKTSECFNCGRRSGKKNRWCQGWTPLGEGGLVLCDNCVGLMDEMATELTRLARDLFRKKTPKWVTSTMKIGPQLTSRLWMGERIA